MIYIYEFCSSLKLMLTIPVDVFMLWFPTQQNFLNPSKLNFIRLKNEDYSIFFDVSNSMNIFEWYPTLKWLIKQSFLSKRFSYCLRKYDFVAKSYSSLQIFPFYLKGERYLFDFELNLPNVNFFRRRTNPLICQNRQLIGRFLCDIADLFLIPTFN